METGRRGRDTKQAAPLPQAELRIWGISQLQKSPRLARGLSTTLGSPAQGTSTGKGGHRISVGIPSAQVRWEAARNPGIFLKRQCTNSLPGTHPGLWQMDDSSGIARVIKRETESCDFGMRAGGRASIASVLSPPTKTAHRHHFSMESPPPTRISLVSYTGSFPATNSLMPHPNQIEHSRRLCQCQSTWARGAVFLKNLSKNSSQAQEGEWRSGSHTGRN